VKWHGIDMRERMAALGGVAGLPIEFVKDTAAACVAELVAGRGRSIRSFLYVFVDTFIGGGLVLDSHLFGGLTGNAGAVGLAADGPLHPRGEAPRATAQRRLAVEPGGAVRQGRRPT
jgi:predicted NBD/HSP70 family sugar kinase